MLSKNSVMTSIQSSIYDYANKHRAEISPPVPLWTRKEVRKWVKQIGFSGYKQKFYSAHIDGDLLLQLTEEMLCRDLDMTNEIQRKRFERELRSLMRMADYSSMDPTNLSEVLKKIGPEYSVYTYAMLKAGVDRETLPHLTEEQLIVDCGINNSIHRQRIMSLVDGISISSSVHIWEAEDMPPEKCIDVFISYRRSNGSQLASLLKVNLQHRGFSVFIDVEGLEAGKFDNHLLLSIQRAKYFLLVLTPGALDRCCGDADGNDWVHREIAAALQANCNIIPIIDKFQWPDPEELPEDMRGVCYFNGVHWIHDYQGACIDKLERFMRGEADAVSESCLSSLSCSGYMSQKRYPTPHHQRKPSSDSGQSSIGLGGSMDLLTVPQAKNKYFITGGSMMDLRSNTPTMSRKWRPQTPIPSTRLVHHVRPMVQQVSSNGHRSRSLDGLLENDNGPPIHGRLAPTPELGKINQGSVRSLSSRVARLLRSQKD